MVLTDNYVFIGIIFAGIAIYVFFIQNKIRFMRIVGYAFLILLSISLAILQDSAIMLVISSAPFLIGGIGLMEEVGSILEVKKNG